MRRAYDVAVVGAGLAGCCAAVTAARAGAKVVLIERGRRAGSKNVIGGILYTPVLERLFPGFSERAPLERPIVSKTLGFLSERSQLSIEVRSESFNQSPDYNHSYTVRRTAFDPWLLEQPRAEGAEVVLSTVVEGLLHEKGDPALPVVGVRCGRDGGDIEARVVILAEGANPLLAEEEGLRAKTTPGETMLGVKEVLRLDRGVIEERFGVEGQAGRAFEFFGDPVMDRFGSGFVYTNSESISVGLAVSLSQLASLRVKPYELLDRFKAHPSIRTLVRGGEPIEYCAHLLPTASGRGMPGLVKDGLLLAGDAARLANMSHYKELTNLVTASGAAAGEAAAHAVKSGDVSAQGLAGYLRRLEASFVIKDIRKFARLADLLERDPGLISRYPRRMVESLVEHFTVSERPKEEVERAILRAWNKAVKPSELRRELVGVLEACGFSLVPIMKGMLAPALRPGLGWLRRFWPRKGGN